MSETEIPESVIEQLTPEERRVLAHAMARLEWELFARVAKRLALFAGIAATAITIFGVASFSTIRTAVVDSASERIAAKADVRAEVVERATDHLQRIDKLMDEASATADEVQRERNRALRLVGSDLSQIREMTKQLDQELRTLKTLRQKTERNK